MNKLSPTKILLTGATGFIGQHLLDELKDDNVSIRIISRKKNPVFWSVNKNIETYSGDIADVSSIENAFRETDVVVNLAAELQDVNKFEATNVTGIKNIIKLSEQNSIKKIIHLSSVGVVGMQYSKKKVVVTEDSPCTPQNEYERTKLKSEMLLTEFAKRSKMEINILRPTNVFGDHHPKKALMGFLQRIKNRSSFPFTTNAIVNYVYVKDVAHAIRFCLQNNIGNKTFNIGKATPFETFLSYASTQLNVPTKKIHLPSFIFAGMELIGYFGLDKLKTKLRAMSNCVEYNDDYMNNTVGYKYGLETGLNNTISFYN